MRRTEYQRKIEIGRTAKRRAIILEVTITAHEQERQTVAHENVSGHKELSIVGDIPGEGGGQMQDRLLESIAAFAPGFDRAKVERIVEVWNRWHLNDLRAGCVHQKSGPYNDPAISQQVCPVTGYRYGHAWLVELLPAGIEEEVKSWGGSTEDLAEQERERLAREFLSRCRLEVRTAFKGDKAPPWDDGSGIHGDRYRITIRRMRETPHSFGGSARRSISFDYWNSQKDMQEGARPSAYDILRTVGFDAFAPTDPDEVIREYGEMKVSRAVAVARFAKKLQDFFTEEELEALADFR